MIKLIKRNKRLCIEIDGELSYTPPDFIKIHNRTDFQSLIADLESGMSWIKAVVKFETKMRP